MAFGCVKRRLARTLRLMADRIDKPAPITIDLRNDMTYMDASHVTQRDIDRMTAYHNAFLGR